MAKRGLGRNLSVLLGQSSQAVAEELNEQTLTKMPLTQLQPGKYQPRRGIEESGLMELAESIKKQGLLQPIVVREVGSDHYEIIAGERRWRACKLAGLTEVSTIIRQVDDETATAMALVENLQREDLNAMDQARAMQRLIDEFDLTHQQVAELLSKSRAAVSNFLRLMQLCDEVKTLLEHGDLDMGHARCLLMLTAEQQRQVALLVVAKSLSVRETEALVARVKSGGLVNDKANPRKSVSPQFEAKLHDLARQWKTKIQLKPGKAGKGSLVIHYEDEDRLSELLNTLQERVKRV
ncbi:ParB/RepB/Spo0J family partition protein [Legionella impletisoli]|uniref:Probable chromosome-partitioning protein ParB n=1 Tax=Legionella impletisoli TaxID=343510 RepID=A0A917JU57_9GAMM|nr:ParB/RepB/Spo0J family partition protein [Legionella impletisoli]GGI86717.1 chromosome partitioning protein ParB [Legionella impletisoli]